MNRHLMEVLRMVAGEEPYPTYRGSYIPACISFLQEDGLITNSEPYQVTDAGRRQLKERNDEDL